MGRASRGPQEGAALLTVLTVLAVLGIMVALLMDRTRPGVKAWSLEAARMQALYLAESGIGYQLYLERYSDSAEPAFGPAAAKDSGDAFLSLKAPKDTFAFHYGELEVPDVRVDRSRAYLDMVATGRHRGETATLRARFGKALDDSVFGPALTLENDVPLEPFERDQVSGSIRLRTPSPGIPSLPWPGGFSVSTYTAEFTDKRYYSLESELQKKLVSEGAESGNGDFEPGRHPPFKAKPEIVHNFGSILIHNEGDETFVVTGPGRLYADQEIRVKGKVRLEKLHLFAGKDITFEDSVSGEAITAFARGSIYVHGRCDFEIEAVANKDIVLRDKAQTRTGSVLISVGGMQPSQPGGAGTGADNTNAVRIVNEAKARGFLIAGGPNGRVAMANPKNRIEGVVMAGAVWLGGGEIHGPVLARRFLCEGTQTRNCLGPGR
ncbi:MAG TPA: hypothetical protein VK465_06890, partial [Fibrobacteria bacterium]|nr:hypothetical protein [Fibrobacteria bacterium]